MLPLSTARFFLSAGLLFVQSVFFLIEVAGIRWSKLFSTNPAETRWKLRAHTPAQRWRTALARQLMALIVLGLLGAIFISIVFSGTRAEGASEITGHDPAALFLSNDTLPACQSIAQVDADIGGDGIRIAIWTQICFLVAIAVLGTFHCKATGAKELGAGLAVTHFSLAVALLVQFGRGTLTPADAVIGAMILDAQNSALLIQLTTKETLAARWQVGIIAACQATGLVVIAFIVQGFRQGRLGAARPDCEQCLSVFWWAFLRNCPSAEAGSDMIMFWLYYACRSICAVQACFLAAVNTQQFHLAEKANKPLNGITFPHMAGYRHRARRGGEEAAGLLSPSGQSSNTSAMTPEEEMAVVSSISRNPNPGRGTNEPADDCPPDGCPASSKLHYSGYPSTVALIYPVYGIFALTSMATAEITMRDSGLRPSSEIFSVGQVTGIVVAGATSVRAAWLFLRMFFENGHGGRFQFLWPFSFDFLGMLYSPTFIVHPSFPVYPRQDGREPRLGDILTVSAGEEVSVSRMANPGAVHGIEDYTYPERIPDALIKVPGIGDLSMDELEVRYLFTDSQDIVRHLLHESEELSAFRLPASLIPTRKRKRNARFMVTGVMLAHRPRTRSTWPAGTAGGSSVLFAYQLQEVKESLRGTIRMRLVYNEAKVAEWSILEDRDSPGSSPSGGAVSVVPVMSGALYAVP
jgi:hypothetical protein